MNQRKDKSRNAKKNRKREQQAAKEELDQILPIIRCRLTAALPRSCFDAHPVMSFANPWRVRPSSPAARDRWSQPTDSAGYRRLAGETADQSA
jgi:hypothetical protein